MKETPHHTRPSLSAIRSAPKWPLQLAAASSFLPVRHRTHQRTEIERLSRSSPSLFSVLIFSDRRLSSTPLEILFFLNGWYYATYFLLELFIFLYKGKAWDLTPTLLAPTSLPHFSRRSLQPRASSHQEPYFSFLSLAPLHCKVEGSSSPGFLEKDSVGSPSARIS